MMKINPFLRRVEEIIERRITNQFQVEHTFLNPF